jgi:hypothetical protein
VHGRTGFVILRLKTQSRRHRHKQAQQRGFSDFSGFSVFGAVPRYLAA